MHVTTKALKFLSPCHFFLLELLKLIEHDVYKDNTRLKTRMPQEGKKNLMKETVLRKGEDDDDRRDGDKVGNKLYLFWLRLGYGLSSF